MSQPLIYRLVRELDEAIALPEPIVEFGSMQVEPGQPNDLRPHFAGRSFTGTDIRPGPGVDRIEDLRALTLADGDVGTALCLDTLEHCEDPPAACRELHRVCADGGVCLISSVMLFGIHGYPNDYFRFTPEGFRSMLGGFDDIDVAAVGDPDIPFVVVGAGAKARELGVRLGELPCIAEAQREWELAEGKLRIGPFRYPPAEAMRVVGRELARHLRWRLGALTGGGSGGRRGGPRRRPKRAS